MTPLKLYSEFFESSRGRIIGLLRRGSRTVEEIASQLRVTGNAVRGQLASMERDGLVQKGGDRRGATRPSRTYELTPGVAQLLSRAYIPLLTELVNQLTEHESPAKVDRIMRDVGRALGQAAAPRLPSGALGARVSVANEWLNLELGASTEAAKTNGHYVIRGFDCPLSALTGKHPVVCHAVESLLAELLGASVRECCDRSQRPRCCFEISARGNGTQKPVRRRG